MQGLDNGLDLQSRLLRAAGQRAHLVGDHREATPLLAGSRRFDRGVERQQVGLLGNRTDHPNHRADLATVALQGLDHL